MFSMNYIYEIPGSSNNVGATFQKVIQACASINRTARPIKNMAGPLVDF